MNPRNIGVRVGQKIVVGISLIRSIGNTYRVTHGAHLRATPRPPRHPAMIEALTGVEAYQQFDTTSSQAYAGGVRSRRTVMELFRSLVHCSSQASEKSPCAGVKTRGWFALHTGKRLLLFSVSQGVMASCVRSREGLGTALDRTTSLTVPTLLQRPIHDNHG